jgi:RimJ/RimL family protein N-acetyltransferase
MCSLSLDPEITKFIDYIKFKDVTQVNDWLQSRIKSNSEIPRQSYNLAVVEKSSGNMIGWIGIGEPSDKSTADLDFGYALLREYWGKGYASEALGALITFCFKELKVHKISGDCDSENIGSIKVMEKVGMKFEYDKEDGGRISRHYSILG